MLFRRTTHVLSAISHLTVTVLIGYVQMFRFADSDCESDRRGVSSFQHNGNSDTWRFGVLALPTDRTVSWEIIFTDAGGCKGNIDAQVGVGGRDLDDEFCNFLVVQDDGWILGSDYTSRGSIACFQLGDVLLITFDPCAKHFHFFRNQQYACTCWLNDSEKGAQPWRMYVWVRGTRETSQTVVTARHVSAAAIARNAEPSDSCSSVEYMMFPHKSVAGLATFDSFFAVCAVCIRGHWDTWLLFHNATG